MGAISYGGYYPKPSSNESIDRATTGVFSNGWESFKRDWETLKLDWKSVEGELKMLDRQSQDKFLVRAKEASLRLKEIIGSE
jgi:hypothetical protein